MIIKVTDANNEDFFATFMTENDYEQKFGPRTARHDCERHRIADQYLTFLVKQTGGFFSNPQNNPLTTQGLGENGVNFVNDSLGAKLVNWTFFTYISALTKKLGPNERIARLFTTTRSLRLDVTFDEIIYSQYFHSLPDLDVASNGIYLESSNAGEGIYWYCGEAETEDFMRKSLRGFTPYDPPQKISDSKLDNPSEFEVDAGGVLDTIIRFDFENTYIPPDPQIPTKYSFKNKTTDKSFVLEDMGNYNYIVVDGEEKKVTATNILNGKIEDVTDKFTGDWIILTPGINDIEWSINDGGDIDRKSIPQLLRCSVGNAELSMTVGGIGNVS